MSIFYPESFQPSPTDGIQEACDAARDAWAGGEVRLEAKLYRLSEPLVPEPGSGQSLHLTGTNGVTLLLDERPSVQITTPLVTIRHNGVYLRNLFLHRRNMRPGVPVLEIGAGGYPGDWRLEHVGIQGRGDYAGEELVHVTGALTGEWVDGIVKYADVAIRFMRPDNMGANNDVILRDMHITRCAVAGIAIDSAGENRHNAVLRLSGCTLESNDTQVLCEDAYERGQLNFWGCWLENPSETGTGILTRGAKVSFKDGTLNGGGVDKALVVTGGEQRHVIEDTRLHDGVTIASSARLDLIRPTLVSSARGASYTPNVQVT